MKLRPGDRSAETTRSEMRRLQDLFGEDTRAAFEFVKHVMHRDNRAIRKPRRESVEVELRSCVSVIAIDPQQTERRLPIGCQLAGKLLMKANTSVDVVSCQVSLEIFE